MRAESDGPAAPVKTSVTELPESRVRVEAEVSAVEVQRSLDEAARELGRQLRFLRCSWVAVCGGGNQPS